MQTKQWRWERGKTRLEDAPCRPRTPAREGGVGVGGWGCLPPGQSPRHTLSFPSTNYPTLGSEPGGVLRESARVP